VSHHLQQQQQQQQSIQGLHVVLLVMTRAIHG
jgi:hypothetical protein